ncbi:hypothetical protein EYD10_02105 [Varanus komodoensis]|nr:hypothetical protein EYD10_02105 [Varanus komodoensis]
MGSNSEYEISSLDCCILGELDPSMGNKQYKLELIVHEGNYDLIGKKETWWDNSHDWNSTVDGYILFKKNRKDKKGGGVALYVRDTNICTEIQEEEPSSPTESIWLKLKGAKNKKNLVVGIYYHPSSQKEDKDATFEKQLASISKKNDVVIMGDFNFPDICWDTNSAKHGPSKRFLTCVVDNFLQQKVEEGTRGSAILDLILTNRDGLVDKITTMGTLGESDRVILEFSIIKKAKANYNKFRKMISEVQWQHTLKGKGVQEGWESLKKKILEAQLLPSRKKCRRQQRKPTWLHKRSSDSLKEEKNMYRKNCIRKAKAENELRIARHAKHNKKAFFRYIQTSRHEKEKGVQLLKVDGSVITDDNQKAETLNTYFASEICNREEVQAGSERWQPKINRQMIEEYLGGINTSKSPGPSELHPRVIKELVEELSEPLAIIFDKSWKTGEVPDDWRRAKVVLIFKKGKEDKPGNYRPVSLTSSPGKNLEQII